MRLTVQLLPLLLLVLLAAAAPGPLALLLALPAVLVLRAMLVFLKLSNRKTDKRIILETISISHYVEKVRWCLDYLGVPYTEEENVGILGILSLGRTVPQLKVPGKDLVIGNSSDILRYLYGEHCTDPAKDAFLRPTSEALELEQRFDLLGEHYRRFAYYNIFSSGHVAVWNLAVWGKYQPGVPAWQKALLSVLTPVFQFFVTDRLRVTREEAETSLKEARAICEEVDELLSDGRKFLLDTPKPTYLDFHFCSMVAVVMTDQIPLYTAGLLSYRTREEFQKCLVPAMVQEAARIQGTSAGKFVINCYEEYRAVRMSGNM